MKILIVNICFLVAITTNGCTAHHNKSISYEQPITKKFLVKEQLSKINKITVQSTHKDQDIHRFDLSLFKDNAQTTTFSNYLSSLPSGSWEGAIAVAILGIMIDEVAAGFRVNMLLDNDKVAELKNELREYDFANSFNKTFIETLQTELDNKDYFPDILKNEKTLKVGQPLLQEDGFYFPDLDMADNTDLLLLVDFVYGLGVSKYEKPKTVILASISAIRTSDKKLIMFDTFRTGYEYKQGHSLDEYVSDGAKLYREDFNEAARTIAFNQSKRFHN